MCGRFTLRTPSDVIVSRFHAQPAPMLQLAIRYNIAPTQSVAVIRQHDGERLLSAMQWGLIPSWLKEPKAGYGTINARADTLATKPSFRTAYKKRRCLIVTDGYYEWKTIGKKKHPYLYEIDGGKPFAFAGLFEQWWGKGEGERAENDPLESCTIITTDANRLASEIHNRMPVILDLADFDEWMDPSQTETAAVEHLLKPYEGDELTTRPVSMYVNYARNEGPECLAENLLLDTSHLSILL